MNEQQLFINSYKQGKEIYVFVYMEECGHCKVVKPHWDKIEKNIKKEFPNAHFIVTKVEHKYINNLKNYLGNITSFPTFLKIKDKKVEKHAPNRDYNSLWNWITGKKNKGGKSRKRKLHKRRKTKRKI
jgi:thiol-disulfide isomerase/thioredoxin